MPALTLATALTLLRMLLAPIFVILVVYHYLGWALITFCAACITDLFDGALARWSGTRTNVCRLDITGLRFGESLTFMANSCGN